MHVTPVADACSFLTVAAAVLDRNPAANNLPLGIAQALIDRPDSYAEAQFWLVEHGSDVVGAALRTPPYPLVVVDPLHPAAVGALAPVLAGTDPDLPGVTANEPWASRFAEAWSAATTQPWHLSLAQGVYVLSAIRSPTPAPGAPRSATDADRPLLERWMHAFESEALGQMLRDEHTTARALDGRLGPGATGGFSIWVVDERPVSLTGWMPMPAGARVGPVYTPPAERGKGYASNLVADVSARMLEGGAPACFLYADLGNPTSNAIYRRIGYEQVATSSMIVFGDRG
ncbi:MAG: GNAT family N-acetyltransferase [Actinomycetota bacterium]|nr:GNAT family N-acetyltransferase [Actinomycetota bacterium]